MTKNEMDLFGMGSADRWSWLLANRLTLMVVGLAWIGMIIYKVALGQPAWFLVAMIPVFAALRLFAFLAYRKKLRR